jgi:hypothetical protein
MADSLDAGSCSIMQDEMSRKSDKQTKAKRKPIARAELEKVIADVVKTSNPECEAFAAVILERIAPGSPGDANWAVKGVKYGKANRELCDVALSSCVTEKQLEFELSD